MIEIKNNYLFDGTRLVGKVNSNVLELKLSLYPTLRGYLLARNIVNYLKASVIKSITIRDGGSILHTPVESFTTSPRSFTIDHTEYVVVGLDKFKKEVSKKLSDFTK